MSHPREEEDRKFWQSNDMKMTRRFIAHMTDIITGLEIIPSYVIHTVERPTRYWQGEEHLWNPINIGVYEALGFDILMKLNAAKRFNLRVQELDYDGKTQEEWELGNCRIEHLFPHDLSWRQNEDQPITLVCQVSFKTVKVNTNVERK